MLGRYSEERSLSGFATNYACFFTGSMSGCLWNARGLCCNNHLRRKAKFKYASNLANKHDFTVFVEAHSAQARCQTLERKLRNTHSFFWCDIPEAPGCGGIGIVLKQSFAAQFSISRIVMVPGRLFALRLHCPNGNLIICGVHAEGDKAHIFTLLSDLVQTEKRATIMVLGDFNAISDEFDRFDATTAKFSGKPCADSVAFEAAVQDLTELAQPDFTRKGVDAAGHVQFSSIDRIYSSLPPSLLSSLSVRVSTLGCVSSPNFDLSDHAPVFFHWAPKVHYASAKYIPAWVPRHPLWPQVVEELRHSIAVSSDAWETEGSLKGLFHKTSSEIKRRVQHHGAGASKEKLWWATKFVWL